MNVVVFVEDASGMRGNQTGTEFVGQKPTKLPREISVCARAACRHLSFAPRRDDCKRIRASFRDFVALSRRPERISRPSERRECRESVARRRVLLSRAVRCWIVLDPLPLHRSSYRFAAGSNQRW